MGGDLDSLGGETDNVPVNHVCSSTPRSSRHPDLAISWRSFLVTSQPVKLYACVIPTFEPQSKISVLVLAQTRQVSANMASFWRHIPLLQRLTAQQSLWSLGIKRSQTVSNSLRAFSSCAVVQFYHQLCAFAHEDKGER